MKKISFEDLLYGLIYACGIAFIGCLLIMGGLKIRQDSKAYKNMKRYCVENNVECYGSKGSYIYVFSDGSVIGSAVMAEYYN